MDVKSINTTALAYLGDAVYEVCVRKYVMLESTVNIDAVNRRAVKFVRADGQAYAIKKFMHEHDDKKSSVLREFTLTDEEAALVKRARNRKTATKAKNADPVTYKWATAFEALVGYLYLTGQMERTELFMNEAIKVIEEKEEKK